jgi:hypothetical protein
MTDIISDEAYQAIKERIDFIRQMPSWASDEFNLGYELALRDVEEQLECLASGNEVYIVFKNRLNVSK